MRSDAPEAFRVRVQTSPGRVAYFGPYATLSAARGAATREASANYYRRSALPYTIERSKQEWETVE